MKHSARFRLLFLSALLAGVFLSTACSPEPASSNEVHVFLWRQQQPGPIERAIAAFEADHPDIEVVPHLGSENASNYYREVTTKLRNRDPETDVFFLDVVWPAEFAARGYLEPLDDRVSASERENFLPATIAANTVDGRLYAMPFTVDVGLLYYRRDLLEKYGFDAPETWSELISQVDTILAAENDPDLYGYAGQFDRYEGLICNVLELVAARSGSLVDRSGQPAVDTPEVIETLAWIRDELIHDPEHSRRASDYLLTAKEQESRAVFFRGDAIFLREWPEAWNVASDPANSEVHDRVAMAPLPAFEDGHSASTLGGWQLGIAAHSSRKDLAWSFVEHMTSHETQSQLAIDRAQAMGRRSIYEDPRVLEAMPHFGRSGPWGVPLRETARAAVSRPRSVRYNALSERMQRCFHEAIRQPDSDIPAIMAECQEQVAGLGENF